MATHQHRCLMCDTDHDQPGERCPNCGARLPQVCIQAPVTISLIPSELALLTHFAESYAVQLGVRQVVQTICDRLATQTSTALTHGQTFADMHRRGIAVLHVDEHGNPIKNPYLD